jgi:hypothetical protein
VKKSTTLDAFCAAFRIAPARPASAKSLAFAESVLGSPLPDALRSFYETCDGGGSKGNESSLRLHSIKSSASYADVPGFIDACWGLWPLVENDDSDPWCLCCRSPLAGYVVQVRHGDEPRLMFRSIDDFLRAAAEAADDGDFPDDDALPSQFDAAESTQSDLAAARLLRDMALTDASLTADERTDAARFACDLFGDDVDAISRLLEIESADIREHVSSRLKRIPGEKARKAAKSATDDFDTFVEARGQQLKTAGIAASVVEMYGKKTIRLDPGPIWLNMDHFYAERKRADANDAFLESVRALVAPKAKKGGKKK